MAALTRIAPSPWRPEFDRTQGVRPRPPLALLASLVTHAVILVALALLLTTQTLPVPRTKVVDVDLVPPPPPVAAPVARSVAPTPPPLPAVVTTTRPAPLVPFATTAPAAATTGMTTATQFFAGQILEDPKNRSIKKTLPLLAPDERIIQLCNIEGLEQLRLAMAGKTPDSLDPSAMADAEIAGDVLSAKDGAYRLDKLWYTIVFTCTAAPDQQSITDFRFKLGAAIPRDQWDSHNLIAADNDLD